MESLEGGKGRGNIVIKLKSQKETTKPCLKKCYEQRNNDFKLRICYNFCDSGHNQHHSAWLCRKYRS